MLDHYVKQRKHPKYLARKNAERTGRKGVSVNACWRPSNEASKEDLHELHQEKMRSKRAHRRVR